MKIEITGSSTAPTYLIDEQAIGLIHLVGPLEETACGLAMEMYDYKEAKGVLTCPTCDMYLNWAKEVCKAK